MSHRLTFILLAVATLVAQGSFADGVWPEKQARDWYAQQPWYCGFNYVPSTAVNTTEMWQADTFDTATIDRELGWAEGLGFNATRVFLQFLVWEQDPDGMKARMNTFLDIANRHGIRVMFILFDDCAFSGKQPFLGKQDAPVPGVHNSCWTPSPGAVIANDPAQFPRLERYVKDLVGAFGQDPRVVVWDLYNEPGNGTRNDSLPLVEAAFRWAREVSPRQPLTMAVWGGESPELTKTMLAQSDVVSFHLYGDLDATRARLDALTPLARPVLCTEWMSRPLKSLFATHLPLFRDLRVGCWSWGLVYGKTQTVFPWGSKPGTPEPEVWFHDLFRADGTPYRQSDLDTIKNYTKSAAQPPIAVPFNQVELTGGFWSDWTRVAIEKCVPHGLKYCESEGKVDNFRIVAGEKEGKHRGACFDDSDLYKVIEGAAYSLQLRRDPALEAQVDEIIRLIAKAQLPDGYVDTYYQLEGIDKRWTDDNMHETYCAGHLIEGAVAYYQATGKDTLLNVGIRFANHIYDVYGPGKGNEVSGHEEIELALMRLWRITNDARYRDLAELFIERRGRHDQRRPIVPESAWIWNEYAQDHKPVREQFEIMGHAVRAMYLYSAMSDVAALTNDSGYLNALDHLWRDVVGRKMYVTGGIGDSSKANEGFSEPFFLPNEAAYCETCASVGMAFWNHRMTLLHEDATYADVVEREMFNGALSGVALDGEHYGYVNTLAGGGMRPPWQGCSCCPTNIARFLTSIAGYAYATRDDALFVNHYMRSKAALAVGGGKVAIAVDTEYPWDGAVTCALNMDKEAAFSLYLRIPAWCQGTNAPDDLYAFEGRPAEGAYTLTVNGDAVPQAALERGYAVVRRTWRDGDTIRLDLPMPILRAKARAEVKADQGRVALQRGPIVYCFETCDNSKPIRCLALPPDTAFAPEMQPQLLGGVTVLEGDAFIRSAETNETERIQVTAVPYYAHANRDQGFMAVWLPENVADAALAHPPTLASESVPSSSVQNADTPSALNDLQEPANSNDQSIPRCTWWGHLGTKEWAQYDFKKPVRVSGVEVYWFDDTGVGQCRVPHSWRVLYREDGKWRKVNAASPGGVARDTYNALRFEPVTTDALRIEAQLPKDFSGGVLEWKVLE